jgi:hypothetical protein
MNWSSELQRPLFRCVSIISSTIQQVDKRGEELDNSLHQETLRPVVGPEGEDLAFAVLWVVSEHTMSQLISRERGGDRAFGVTRTSCSKRYSR